MIEHLNYEWEEYCYDDSAEIGEEAGWGICTREAEDPDRSNWNMTTDSVYYMIRRIRLYNEYRRLIHHSIVKVRQGLPGFSVRLGDFLGT